MKADAEVRGSATPGREAPRGAADPAGDPAIAAGGSARAPADAIQHARCTRRLRVRICQ